MNMASPIYSPTVNVDELLSGFGVQGEIPSRPITGITSNSREVKPGNLFIAQAGLSRHAIDFVTDAVESGAIAVLYDVDDPYCRQRVPIMQKQVDVDWIALSGLQQLTGEIASRYYGAPSERCRLIGITGTDGKTSVTHLLVQALVNLEEPVGSIGTLGYGLANRLTMTNYTTPDAITLQSLIFELVERGCQTLVMEVSSHALEQFRVSGCDFDIAVLTNLTSDHLDYHGSRQNYAAAKSALFEFSSLRNRVLNLADQFGRELAAKHRTDNIVTYSTDRQNDRLADVRLLESQMSGKGLCVVMETPQGKIRVQSALIGRFNIDNLLACATVLFELGYSSAEIQQAMQNLQPIPGRMQYFPAVAQQAAVVIDFAHTEQALAACLESIKDTCEGEVYCVFGCGGDRDQSKRPKMGRVAEQLSDHVFITDDNPRHEAPESIARQILTGIEEPSKVNVIHDRQAAIETAIAQAGKDDLVVIAGKGHEQIQIVGDQRLPFSDARVVRELRQGVQA